MVSSIASLAPLLFPPVSPQSAALLSMQSSRSSPCGVSACPSPCGWTGSGGGGLPSHSSACKGPFQTRTGNHGSRGTGSPPSYMRKKRGRCVSQKVLLLSYFSFCSILTISLSVLLTLRPPFRLNAGYKMNWTWLTFHRWPECWQHGPGSRKTTGLGYPHRTPPSYAPQSLGTHTGKSCGPGGPVRHKRQKSESQTRNFPRCFGL